MRSSTDQATYGDMMRDKPSEPARPTKPFADRSKGQPAGRKAPVPEKETKRTFTTTITRLNDLKLASLQRYKPGGAQTTDVINEALELYFKAHKLYADAYLEEKK